MENFNIFTQYTHYFSIIKNDLSWLNNLFMISFQLIIMSSYAKNKLQMCWVTQHQCRSLQMWKIFTNSPSTLTFCLLQKNDLSRLNNLFMASFQLIRMSSFAKNKQQMCWVTQHQCRSRQMWKIFSNSPSTLTFCLLQKWQVLPEKSIHGNFSTHKDVLWY